LPLPSVKGHDLDQHFRICADTPPLRPLRSLVNGLVCSPWSGAGVKAATMPASATAPPTWHDACLARWFAAH